MDDDSWIGWLVGGALVGICLLLGFILKWLGLLDWFYLIAEVALRAVALAMFVLGGALVYCIFKKDMDREKDTEVWGKSRWWHSIFQCALLLGAAVVMTFWDKLGLG